MYHTNWGNYGISLHVLFASYRGRHFGWRRTGRSAAWLYGPVLFIYIFFLHFSGVVAGKTEVTVIDMTTTDNPLVNSTITAYRHGFLASLWARNYTVGEVSVTVTHENVNLEDIASKISSAARKHNDKLVVIFGPIFSRLVAKSAESLRANNLVAFGPFTDAMHVRDWNQNFYFFIGSTYEAVYALLKYAVMRLRLRRVGYMFLDDVLFGKLELGFANKLLKATGRSISAVFKKNIELLSKAELKKEWEQFAEKRPQAIIVMGTSSENTRSFLQMVFRDNRTQEAYLLVPMNQQSFVLSVWEQAVADGTPFEAGQLISTGSNPMATAKKYKCIQRFQKEMSDYLRGSGRTVYSDELHYLNNDIDGEMMVAGWMAGEVFMQTLSTYDSSCNRTCYMDSLFAQRRYFVDDFVLGDYGGKIDPKAKRQGATSECNQGGNVIFLKTFVDGFRAIDLEDGREIISLNKCSQLYEFSDPVFAVLVELDDVGETSYIQEQIYAGAMAAINKGAKHLYTLKVMNTMAREAADDLRNEKREFMTDIILGTITDDMLEVPGLIFVDPFFIIAHANSFDRNILYFTPTMEQHLFVMAEYLVVSGYRSAHILFHVRPATHFFDIVRRTFDSFQITLESAVEVDTDESIEGYLPTSGMTLLIEVQASDIEVIAGHLERNKKSQLVMQFVSFAIYFPHLRDHIEGKEIADRLLITTNLPHWANNDNKSEIISEYRKSFPDRRSWSPLSLNAFVTTKLMQEVIDELNVVSARTITDHIYSKVVLTLGDIVFGPFSDGGSVTCTGVGASNTAACAKNYGASSIAVWSLSRVFDPTVPPLAEGITPSMVYRVHGIGLTRSQLIGIIVGCALGCLLLVVLVIVLMCCCHDSRDNRDAPKERTAPVTLVFTDIESSTALWAACPKDMPDAVATHHRLIRSLIAKHNCYEVKTIGDSFMIACRSTFAAVQLVRELQQVFMEQDWGTTALDDMYRTFEETRAKEDGDGQYVPPTARLDADVYRQYWNGLRVRVGVHTGLCDIRYDPVTKGYDYYGSTSNTAARTESITNGGQVLLTRAVYMALSTAERAQVDVTLLGAVALRGVPQPVEMYQLDAVPGRTFAALRLEREANDLEECTTSESLSFSMTNETLKGDTAVGACFLKVLMSAYPAAERRLLLSRMCNRWGLRLTNKIRNVTSEDQLSELVIRLAVKVGEAMQFNQDSSVTRCTDSGDITEVHYFGRNAVQLVDNSLSLRSTQREEDCKGQSSNLSFVSLGSCGTMEFFVPQKKVTEQ